MKIILTYIITSLLLCSFTITGDDIVSALKSGNASQVSKFFDNTVDITFTDRSNAYSKSQAELVLKDFFSTNGVKSFIVIHKGDNESSLYYIGILQTKNGQYRTTIYLKQKGDRQLLQELRFEK